jgi:inhibitor of KinA
MPPSVQPLSLKPLGDQAILAYLPNEAAAAGFAATVRAAGFPWLVEVVPAYACAGIFFNPEQIDLAGVRGALARVRSGGVSAVGRTHVIPCCYELQLDLDRVAEHTGLPADKIIEKHTAYDYTVYAIGFCPGFPYLGYLPPELTGVPRLASPRLQVEPGSVGLTGRQTGLYPLARPGGWHLIGRTPFTLVDVAEGYFPLRVADRVRFRRIDRAEYERLKGERLPT